VIAHKSTSEQIGFLRKLFYQYNTEKNGVLSTDEFKAAMAQTGLPDEELENMFDAVVRESYSLTC
jgi:Ca2+-binding EF-hand superfamily protein